MAGTRSNTKPCPISYQSSAPVFDNDRGVLLRECWIKFKESIQPNPLERLVKCFLSKDTKYIALSRWLWSQKFPLLSILLSGKQSTRGRQSELFDTPGLQGLAFQVNTKALCNNLPNLSHGDRFCFSWNLYSPFIWFTSLLNQSFLHNATNGSSCSFYSWGEVYKIIFRELVRLTKKCRQFQLACSSSNCYYSQKYKT